MLSGQALRLRDVADLIVLGRAGVQRPAQEQLRHHAAERPHIDRLAERQPEDYFGCSAIKWKLLVSK